VRIEKQVQETQENQEQKRQEVGYDLHVAVCWHYFLARRNPDRNSAAKRSKNKRFENMILLHYGFISSLFHMYGNVSKTGIRKWEGFGGL